VYCRILSTVSMDFGSIADRGGEYFGEPGFRNYLSDPDIFDAVEARRRRSVLLAILRHCIMCYAPITKLDTVRCHCRGLCISMFKRLTSIRRHHQHLTLPGRYIYSHPGPGVPKRERAV
jgi:hypothetical protein